MDQVPVRAALQPSSSIQVGCLLIIRPANRRGALGAVVVGRRDWVMGGALAAAGDRARQPAVDSTSPGRQRMEMMGAQAPTTSVLAFMPTELG